MDFDGCEANAVSQVNAVDCTFWFNVMTLQENWGSWNSHQSMGGRWNWFSTVLIQEIRLPRLEISEGTSNRNQFSWNSERQQYEMKRLESSTI